MLASQLWAALQQPGISYKRGVQPGFTKSLTDSIEGCENRPYQTMKPALRMPFALNAVASANAQEALQIQS